MIEMSDALAFARDAQKPYGFMKHLVTPVYDVTDKEFKKTKKRNTQARLFVGDWAKKVCEKDGMAKILFRGGKGYVPMESVDGPRLLEFFFLGVSRNSGSRPQTGPSRFKFVLESILFKCGWEWFRLFAHELLVTTVIVKLQITNYNSIRHQTNLNVRALKTNHIPFYN